MAYDPIRDQIVLFGGYCHPTSLSDTWIWDGESWEQLDVNGPSARRGHTMTFDRAHGEIILFGGSIRNGGPYNDTWAWDGEAWALRASEGPSPREAHAAAYDESREQIVLVGGDSGEISLADTWAWNGSAWQLLSPDSLPARSNHAMAYDATRKELILNGGDTGTTYHDATWVWNGESWTPRISKGFHSRIDQALSYDHALGQILLFGGRIYRGSVSPAAVYKWDGSHWKTHQDTPTPPYGSVYDIANQNYLSIGYHGPDGYGTYTWKDGVITLRTRFPAPSSWRLVYDRARQQVVMLKLDMNNAAKTYTWNGDGWELKVSGGPAKRSGYSMVYDAEHEQVVLHGGSYSTTTIFGDTWTWNGAQWQLRGTPGPSPRSGSQMIYDPQRRETLLAGGGDGSQPLVDLWAWDGVQWHERDATTLDVYSISDMAFDPISNRPIVYSNRDDTTWTWDGAQWTQQASQPDATGSGLSTDPFTGQVFLSEKLPSGSCYSSAHALTSWAWDGERWTTRTEPVINNRLSHAVVEDLARGELVLFGGTQYKYASCADGTTWTYDGQRWTRKFPEQSPPQRYGHGMAYDSTRQETVLFSGGEYHIDEWDVPTNFYRDTWVWDGTNWELRADQSGPSRRAHHTMAYNPVTERTILYGGIIGFSWYFPYSSDETWAWDGTQWEELSLQDPPKLLEPQLVFDHARNELILVGVDAPSPFEVGDSQTWAWDGQTWVERQSTGLSADTIFDMDYDPATREILLVSGTRNRFNEIPEVDVWAWSGERWTPRATSGVTPGGIVDRTFTHYSPTDEMLLLGGTGGSSQLETWAWLNKPCTPADLNTDGIITTEDFQIFAGWFINRDPRADLNNDTIFDFGDIGIFATTYLEGCPD